MGGRSHKWDVPVMDALQVRPRTARELAQDLGTTVAVIHITMSNLKRAGRTLITDYLAVDYSNRSVALYGLAGVHPPRLVGTVTTDRRGTDRRPQRKPRATSGSGHVAGHVYYRQLSNWR